MRNYLKLCTSNKILQGKKIELSHSRLPYLKKITNIAGFEVWLVDGEFIRKFISEDFVNFDQHFHLKFIPKNEFWIDYSNKHHEMKFYIDHLYIESRLMARGKSYSEAYKEAEKYEKKERAKSKIIKGLRKLKLPKEELIKKVKEKLIIGSKVKVWLVNGSLVRSLFFIDYAAGGHDKVYRFIPKGEIWIDDDLSEKERKYILLHELHERNQMARGKSYSEAHQSATEIEDFCRHNPKKLKYYLKKEIAK